MLQPGKGQWAALLSFSAAAWKCAARDRWIGWDFRHQYDRLHLLANNSRFVILPDQHWPNLASRVLSLCEHRLRSDWPRRFGYPLLMLETFVDPQRFRGTLYRASNWLPVGETRGFRRTRQGYSDSPQAPKSVFVRPLHPRAQALLSRPILGWPYCKGVPKIMLSAEQMCSLPGVVCRYTRPTPRPRAPPSLPAVLAIAAAATLCGQRGYKAIAEWADDLGQKARARFRCRWRNRRYTVPSESIIRNVLIRLDPEHLDRALQRWNALHNETDESLAIDGKTMCNAIDKDGHQTHILSAIGHHTHTCYTKKSRCFARTRR